MQVTFTDLKVTTTVIQVTVLPSPTVINTPLDTCSIPCKLCDNGASFGCVTCSNHGSQRVFTLDSLEKLLCGLITRQFYYQYPGESVIFPG